VVSFSGRATDGLLKEQEDRLRGWLAKRGEKSSAEPEYAFYNSPLIPGPLRRNEVWWRSAKPGLQIQQCQRRFGRAAAFVGVLGVGAGDRLRLILDGEDAVADR